MRRSASRSSRCGTGRAVPTSSNGAWCAVRASRPQSATLAGSAHCKSSMTRMTGRTALSSGDEREQLLGQRRGHVRAPSAAISPQQADDRVAPRIDRGSRTRRASRNGSSGSAMPSRRRRRKRYETSVSREPSPRRARAWTCRCPVHPRAARHRHALGRPLLIAHRAGAARSRPTSMAAAVTGHGTDYPARHPGNRETIFGH